MSPVVGANTDLFSQAQAFLQNNQLQQAIKCYRIFWRKMKTIVMPCII